MFSEFSQGYGIEKDPMKPVDLSHVLFLLEVWGYKFSRFQML